MAKNKEIIITKEQSVVLVEALQGKIDELSKIATSLMKKGLSDAEAPVYAAIKRIQEEIKDIEEMASGVDR